MSLTHSRKLEILDSIIGRLADFMPIHEIVMMLTSDSQEDWSKALSSASDGAGYVFEDLHNGDGIYHEEFDELMRPHLARCLKDSLEAKKRNHRMVK